MWLDIDWIRVWLELIKTLWYSKQVNVRFEWKSNVRDSAPMSKVEGWWKIELEEDVNELGRLIMEEYVNGLD